MRHKFSAPKKSLGQNFLQDQAIIARIVSSLNIREDDIVVEIGPGRGALTDKLLNVCKTLHVIEYDNVLIEYWQERAKNNPKLVVHHSDILSFDFNQLETTRPVKVIGNLPYNISNPILLHLIQFSRLIERQIFMLQKEVVDRIVATPGGKIFGRLSVMIQQQNYTEHLFDVPPTAFNPPPKVNSAIIEIIPLVEEFDSLIDKVFFEELVKVAFSQRRKTIKNTLSSLAKEADLIACYIDPKLRPEAVRVDQYTQLSNYLSEKSKLS